jgi:polysaccharide biosynthesis/export protein
MNIPTTDNKMAGELSILRKGRVVCPRILIEAFLGVLLIVGMVACQEAPSVPTSALQKEPEVQTVREGDVLKIAFPGAPNLDTTQQVRRDGRITLNLVGEVLVAGMTPGDVETDLSKRFSTQLLSSAVNVSVVSSSFVVFVTGSVIKPGKILPDHPITALEAVMEAGGFITDKADMKAVVVVRQENGTTHNYTLNLKEVLDGKSVEAFYLKPSDIVFVPEKFSWF